MSAVPLAFLLATPLLVGQTSQAEVYPEVLLTYKPKDAVAWRQKLPPLKPVDFVSLTKASDLESLPALRIRFPKAKVDVLIDRACFAFDSLFIDLLFRESAIEFLRSNGFQPAVINGQTEPTLYKRTFRLFASGRRGLESQEDGLPSGEYLLSPAIAGYLIVNGAERWVTAHLPLPKDLSRRELNPAHDLVPDSIPQKEFQVTNLMERSRSVQALSLAGEAWRMVYKKFADLADRPSLYGGPRPEKQKPVPFSSLPEWKQKALLNYQPVLEIGQSIDREEVRKTIRNSLFRQSYVGVEVIGSSPSPNGNMGGASWVVMLSRRG